MMLEPSGTTVGEFGGNAAIEDSVRPGTESGQNHDNVCRTCLFDMVRCTCRRMNLHSGRLYSGEWNSLGPQGAAIGHATVLHFGLAPWNSIRRGAHIATTCAPIHPTESFERFLVCTIESRPRDGRFISTSQGRTTSASKSAKSARPIRRNDHSNCCTSARVTGIYIFVQHRSGHANG